MSAQRLFVIIGLAAALLFTFITPPFQVPDEVGHFWRAYTIAQGHLLPRIERQGGVASVPQGISTFVFLFWRDAAHDVHITREQWKLAQVLPLEPEKRVRVEFPAGYTPVPYAPQALAALITRITDIPPIITFFLGRLFNAIAYVLIIAAAIHIAPSLKWVFAAAALLPMALYLAASWSPDAMTIALSFLFTAALLRGARTARDALLLAACGALVALCKPAYFLIVLLVFVVAIVRTSWRVYIIVATAIALAFSMWNASLMPPPIRPDAVVDPHAQVECLRTQPMQFVHAFQNELRFDYVHQAVGRLGILNLLLPDAIVWVELALLAVCAWTGIAVSLRVRVAALVIVVGTIIGIALSLYIGWTPPCAKSIDGLQGRYLLPIVPLIFAVISAPLIRRERVTAILLLAGSVASIATALYAVSAKYYGLLPSF